MNTYPKYIHITHISISDILMINRSNIKAFQPEYFNFKGEI